MKKRILNQIAKDYSACILVNAMECGATSELLTDDEQLYLSEKIAEISERIGFNGFGKLDDIIRHHIFQDQLNRKQKA